MVAVVDVVLDEWVLLLSGALVWRRVSLVEGLDSVVLELLVSRPQTTIQITLPQ